MWPNPQFPGENFVFLCGDRIKRCGSILFIPRTLVLSILDVSRGRGYPSGIVNTKQKIPN